MRLSEGAISCDTGADMKHLTSSELLIRLKDLVADERRATIALIECLEEAQKRRLYAEYGYGSLWEFATKELGLSEGAAQRRIAAMRLTVDVPAAKCALESGELSLSNAAKVQVFRQAARKLGQEPDALELVKSVQGLSQRDCEKKLYEIQPEALPREKERIVSEQGERELKITIGPELHEKLQRLRGMLAHAIPEASYAELLEFMTDEVLLRLEKKKGIGLEAEMANAAAAEVEKENPLPEGVRVHIPEAVKRAVGARSGGQCEVTANGRRCTSRYRVELDHSIPLALGGSNELSNLRHACRNHNSWLARRKLGREGRPSRVPVRPPFLQSGEYEVLD